MMGGGLGGCGQAGGMGMMGRVGGGGMMGGCMGQIGPASSLEMCTFDGMELGRRDFSLSDFYQVTFRGANLEQARFTGATLLWP